MWVVRYRIRKFDNLLLTIKFKTGFMFALKWQEPRFETLSQLPEMSILMIYYSRLRNSLNLRRN